MKKITRKEALSKISLSSALLAIPLGTDAAVEKALQPLQASLKGNINHSVCKWCYPDIALEALCEAGKGMGLKSVELLEPEQWPIVAKYGLTCAMANGSPLGINDGFNNPDHHKELQRDYFERLPVAAEYGIKNMICFSGVRNGIDRQEGLENCARGLEPVVKEAAKYGITIAMELLNSKVDHTDYQCDRTAWGVELVEKIGDDSFKLLYDIYHMQVMEGDIISTIKEYHSYFSHYHTGGVPGRAEINQSQELYYPAIMKAINETGFKGFVAQEFIPKGPEPLKSLEKGVLTCDV
ncbi:MAG: TIM barrel protein [Bacteroidota bacterium]